MIKMLQLKNEYLTVEISTYGAEIQRVTASDGTEFLWNGDPAVWNGRAPILFPICGGLKDDKYIYNGKEYTLQKHGFAKEKTFCIAHHEDTRAELTFSADEETKKNYPFDFVFHAEFALDKNTLNVSYHIENLTDSEMYFSVGAHEAYACPEGIGAYSIEFDKTETLDQYMVNGSLLETEPVRMAENIKELLLKPEYFAVDALIFKHLNSNKVALKHNDSNKKITVSFPEHEYLLFWTIPGANYLCIEPWCGFPDSVDSNYDFKHKEGILCVAANQTKALTHTITFEH